MAWLRLGWLRCICLCCVVWAVTIPLSQAADEADTNTQAPLQKRLSLKQAEELFAAHNRELLSAKRSVESAEAGVLIAAQRPNPMLSLGFSNINLNQRQGNSNQNGKTGFWYDTYTSGVQITQLYERGNKRAFRTSVAQAGVQASVLDFKDTYRQQGLAMASAYYDLKFAQDALDIQQSNVALYDKALQTAELRLAAGDVSVADVTRIKVDALRARNDLRQAEADVHKARALLGYFIGSDAQASDLIASDPWPALASETFRVADDWLRQRADVQAADARMQQAEQARNLAQSLKTRDITWSLAYQHFPGQEPGTAPDTVGASVNIPLFTNYQYAGELARAEVNYTSAQDAKAQVTAAALVEVQRAQADLLAAIDKNRRFDADILLEAKKAAEVAEFAYLHGASNVMDLLDARRILRALQLEAVAVKADYAKSLAAWQAATYQAFIYTSPVVNDETVN